MTEATVIAIQPLILIFANKLWTDKSGIIKNVANDIIINDTKAPQSKYTPAMNENIPANIHLIIYVALFIFINSFQIL